MFKILLRSLLVLPLRAMGLKYTQDKQYVLYKKLGCIYISIPKSANTSVNGTLLKHLGVLEDLNETHKYKKRYTINKRQYLSQNEDYFTFTFVRNPLTRLVSCYTQKVKKENHYAITRTYFGLIHQHMSFDEFIDAVCVIPDCVADEHFRSQSSIIFPKNKILPIDYVGKVENFDLDFNNILDLLNMDEKPIHFNISNPHGINLNEWYTPELAYKVYKRYKKDFDNFEYKLTF